MTAKESVYRGKDGVPTYDGPPWKELDTAQRTARIKECHAFGYRSPAMIAQILKIRRTDGNGFSEGAIVGHMHRYPEAKPASHRKTEASVTASARRYQSPMSGAKLSGENKKALAQRRGEEGRRLLAKVEAQSITDEKVSEPESLTGFCVAVNRRGDYCGLPAEKHTCPMHLQHPELDSRPRFEDNALVKI